MNITILKETIKQIPSLREKDKKFNEINKLIDAKKQFLIEKQKTLQNIEKQNRFLSEVKEDYTKYYEYISQQKKDQIKALSLLDNYIKDLTSSGELTKMNIEDAREEQNRILSEVEKIKMSLDEIIEPKVIE